MDVPHLVETTLEGMGYELVDLEISGRGMMRVFIDKPPVGALAAEQSGAEGLGSGGQGSGDALSGITLDDCERVSNQLTRLFTVEGVAYERLEVSSPGLDRPLKKEADFVRFRGERSSLKLRVPLDGRKNFVGVLGEVKDGMLELTVDGKQVEIALSNVDKARLSPEF